MSVRWALLAGAAMATVLATLAGVLLPHTAEAASTCAPARARAVTVLARLERGQSYRGVASDELDPFIDPLAGRTVVPLRSLVSAVSLDSSADWDAASRTAAFRFGAHSVNITFARGSTVSGGALVDGRFYSVPSVICGGHIYAQVRPIAEALGAYVEYDTSGVVLISPPENVYGSATTAVAAAPAPKVSSAVRCEVYPENEDYLISPAAAIRQAARATACYLRTQAQ